MEDHSLLIGLTSIIVLGIGAHWLSWRLRFPSILLMFIFGLIAGPITGLLQPDVLLGDLLFPIVSLFVAIILFEGGLSLKLDELREEGKVIHNLIVVGVFSTWVLSTAAAYFLLGFSIPLATLLGAILVVTGPTVIIPLLQHVRPSGRISSIVRWEGIVNDPIAAILAVIIFEAILSGSFGTASAHGLRTFFQTLLVGASTGAIAAFAMIVPLRRYWIPDFLHNSMSLMMVILTFTASNLVQPESGLLATTVMGFILANQSSVTVKHIIAFKEDLRVLLISTLFIVLTARLDPEYFFQIGWPQISFLVILILVIRPLTVWLSTLGSELTGSEKGFLAFLAPRGIVAAAISTLFAERLVQAGYPDAEALVPITFFVIAGTVTLYGLSASPLARWLGLAEPNPQGMLLVGAHQWARDIAHALKEEGYLVRLVDTNPSRVARAKAEGLEVEDLNILSESDIEKLNLQGLGHMLALTSNDEVNSLAILHCMELFDRSEVYQLAPYSYHERKEEKIIPKHLRGRLLFRPAITYDEIQELFTNQNYLETIALSEELLFEDFQETYNDKALPMFLLKSNGNLAIFNANTKLDPSPGDKIIALIDPSASTQAEDLQDDTHAEDPRDDTQNDSVDVEAQ